MTAPFHPLDAWRTTPYDAVIVGGGPAGLSAALVLGRARKRVLVVDEARPANAVSQGVGGLLGHDRVKPADLRDSGRRQLEEHDVELRHCAVEDVEPIRDGFLVTPADGAPVRAHALVLAHGLRYDPPPLPGIEALWGRSVFHCAFCDGWEVRDRPLAFHGSGPAAVRSALVLASWSNDVVLCTDGAPDPGGDVLAAAGVRVRTEPIARLAGHDGSLEQIEFSRGRAGRAPRSAVRQHAAGPAERARRRARLRADRGRDDRHRRRRADDRPRRVRRRRRGDRALAVGGQRDRHRVARRLRGRARAPRAGRCRRRLSARSRRS